MKRSQKRNKVVRSVWRLISRHCFPIIEPIVKYCLIEGIKFLIKTFLN
jgi:hypothetical protein